MTAIDDIEWLLTDVGLGSLTAETPVPMVEDMLRALVRKLNGADPLRRATIRHIVIDRLKEAKLGAAARLVDAALGPGEKTNGTSPQGQAVAFTDPEPASEAVDGAELLEEIQAFLARFCSLGAGADVMLAAFAVATYAVELFPSAPYVVVHSPAPQCGKTRVLEALALLIRRPWLTLVPSTAVLFRVLEGSSPTLLLDEAEVVRGRGDAAADVRALLQSGYRRGAVVPRCVGDANEVRNFRVFGPKVFALIGELPAALFDRCIPVKMQRRERGEQVERFRPTQLELEALALRRRARRWVADNATALGHCDLPTLAFLDERQEEVWEPLLAVGDVAGAGWYDRLVAAARALSGDREATSTSLELLEDIRAVFSERDVDRISSSSLAQALTEREGRRWAEWSHGKPLSANGLARLLKGFGIAPIQVWLDGQNQRGYTVGLFQDAFNRYAARTSSVADDNRASNNREEEGGLALADSAEIAGGDSGSNGLAVQMGGEDRGDAWEPPE